LIPVSPFCIVRSSSDNAHATALEHKSGGE
jgi:hypothetical protein